MNFKKKYQRKSIKKYNFNSLNNLKINQKIVLGYGVALAISVIGIFFGVTIGNYWKQKALEQEEQVLAEIINLHNLQTAALQVRNHQQKLIALTNQPKKIETEYSQIIKHSQTIEKLWSKIELINIEQDSHSKEDISKLRIFLQTYEGVTKEYVQSLNQIIKDIRIVNLDSLQNNADVQTKLLEFTNNELAIKIDNFSEDLSEIIKIYYRKVNQEKKFVNNAIIFGNWIIFSGVLISIILVIILAKKTSRAITSPIIELTNIARRVTEEENFDLLVPVTATDEIGSLAYSFKHLINRVKQLLEEQTTNTANLRAIIDNLADGLLVSDANGKIINYNPAMTRMFGLGDVNIRGLYCYEFIPEVAESLDKIQQNPKAVFTTEIQPNDKKIAKASVTAILENNEQKSHCSYLGAVILLRDITQEKEVDRMKTDFISTVSHELRTPLTSVLGFASIIQEKLEDDVFPLLPDDNRKTKKTIRRVKDNINIIISEAERLTALINDVLDIAKMEAGKIDWKKENINIEKIIERSFAATSALLSNKGLELIKDIELEIPQIIGDKNRLIQVLINLISNAIKFTDEGSITCRAKVINNEIVVSIIDTGYGIEIEEQNKVFDKFKQVGETLTDKPQGTGLGLPICKEIIEHHGGNIWVESKLNEGSNFSFSLPINTVSKTYEGDEIVNLDNFVKQLQEHSTNNGNISEVQKTILVVDDDANIRELLRQSLQRQNYAVKEAKNGLDAINQIKTQKPDLIILDVMMPQINGFDTAAVIKNDPITMDIPIIMLSIFEDKQRGYKLGIDRYMTKPIDSDKLINEIGLLLSQNTSSKKVLVVDNTTSNLFTLSEILKKQGYNVVEASNGEECIEKALSVKPDMIIVDSVLSQKHDLVQILRFEKGLENFCFILLGDNEK